jgi:hypothetical protein
MLSSVPATIFPVLNGMNESSLAGDACLILSAKTTQDPSVGSCVNKLDYEEVGFPNYLTCLISAFTFSATLVGRGA